MFYVRYGGDTVDKKKDEIIKLLPLDIRKLFKFCDIEFSKLQEIRLRVNMPIMILYDSMEYLFRAEVR